MFGRAPPVCHESAYRDVETGFHTNDAESENHRVKRWSRARYGKLNLTEADMGEYVYYVNVGDDVSSVMRGLATASGGVVNNNPVLRGFWGA